MGQFMKCIRSFTAEIDGERQTFVAGATYVDSEHESVQRHPDAFVPDDRPDRLERVRQLAGNRRAREDGVAYARGGGGDGARFDYARGLRSDATPIERGRTVAIEGAMRTLESYHVEGQISSEAACVMENLAKSPDDRMGLGAAYLEAVGRPAYASAFGKLITDPTTGHLRLSAEEVDAVRRVNEVELQRGMVEGTDSAGGLAVPIQIDPTILLTSSGALNPIRDFARVIVITTDKWRGVSSAGVVASYDPESAEVSDDSPTLAQPTIDTNRGTAFVPYSMELGMDWATLSQELGKLIADARDVLDATEFLSGSSTNGPAGILTGLTTSQRVQTASTAAYAVADPWTLKNAIPPRFIANRAFAAAPGTWDVTYRFVGTNSTEPVQFDAGRGGTFLGRPRLEWSTMSTGATSGTKIMLAGDFFAGFTIADRLGLSVSVVPFLFGPNRRPTGESGLFAMWMTGTKVVVPEALRYLEAK